MFRLFDYSYIVAVPVGGISVLVQQKTQKQLLLGRGSLVGESSFNFGGAVGRFFLRKPDGCVQTGRASLEERRRKVNWRNPHTCTLVVAAVLLQPKLKAQS